MAYVKDEGAIMNTFTNVWVNIVSCVPLILPQPYANNCFRHALSKCYMYAINDLKVCASMREVSVKDAHASL